MQCLSCHAANADNARFCNQCGAALPVGADAPRGERRYATVLFADLSGYTALTERLDPEEVEGIMVRIKRLAQEVIERHGGFINQFIGDEVVALFGVPQSHADDAQRAVRAALDLHRAVDTLADEYAARIDARLSLHSGINTGMLVARRSDARDGHFALTGDVVNTGARLLSLAGNNEVLVGPETWQAIRNVYAGVARPPTLVKGKEQPLVPYAITGYATYQVPAAPMVGRENELQRGLAALAGGRLLLQAEAGMGKSRLVAAIADAARARGMAVHMARVFDFGRQRDHDPIRRLMSQLPGISAAPADAIDQALLDDLLGRQTPELREVLGATAPTMRHQRLLALLERMVTVAATAAPLLLVLEDIHWADDWTLERWNALLAGRGGCLLCTARPEFAGTRLLGAVETIALRALDDTVAWEMTTGYDDIPLALRTACVQRAAGNPLFLEQLLLNARGLTQDDVPGSIQSLVQARIDRLAPQDKLAVQSAAILGQCFAVGALLHMLDQPAYDPMPLLQAGLLTRDGDDVRFSHALICAGAYQSMLRADRRRHHLRAAEWFAGDPALAAAHWQCADDSRAAAAYLQAGEAEAAAYRFEAALAAVDQGLLAPGVELIAGRLHTLRGRILLDWGRATDAVQAFRSALQAADPAVACESWLGMANSYRIIDRLDDAMQALVQAEPLATTPQMLARSHFLRGNLLFARGDIDGCLTAHQQSLAAARSAGSVADEIAAYGGLGDAYFMRGRFADGYQAFEQCVGMAKQHGHLRVAVANLPMLGACNFGLLRLDEALEKAEQARQLAVRLSHQRAEIISHAVTAWTRYLQADFVQARAATQRGLDGAQQLNATRFESEMHMYLALIDYRCGQLPAARLSAERAVQLSRQCGMSYFGAAVLGTLALVSDPAHQGPLWRESEDVLRQGSMIYTHHLYRWAGIDAALDRTDYDDAQWHVNQLRAAVGNLSAPDSALLIGYGQAMIDVGRGLAGAVTTLRDLRQHMIELRVGIYLPQVDAMLKRGG